MAGRLRAKQIGALRPGRHGDGGTLFIVVEPGGRSRHWVQRLTVDGKRRDLGLGGYPYVGLADARAAAFANRQLARRGGDPTAAVRQSRVPTFRTACERVDAAATWKGDGAKNRRSALERCCGSILDRRMDQIRRADVISILAPVMADKRATGSKLHGWIRAALAWSVAREYVEFNVCGRHRRGVAIRSESEEEPRSATLLGGGDGTGRYREFRGARHGEGLSTVHHTHRGSIG